MSASLLERSRTIRVTNSVAAGTTNSNSSGVDMSQDNGYRGVKFVAAFGTLTSTQVTSLKAQGSTDNSNWNDISGSSTGPLADGDGNKTLILDCKNPTYRYMRAVVLRGTANAVIDGVFAQLYDPILPPATRDTGTCSAQKSVFYPTNGTP